MDKIIENDLYGVLIKSCIVRGPLSVVTHGDVWAPNFLIKHQGTKPETVKMIDFQLARYTTIVTDLSFFLYTCVSPDLVETKWDELIVQYHQFLVESMQRYGAKTSITLEMIQSELKEHSIMGIGMSMEALVMAQLEDDDVSDLDGIKVLIKIKNTKINQQLYF